jgi:phosphomannomutase
MASTGSRKDVAFTLDNLPAVLALAEKEITGYLTSARDSGRIDETQFQQASKATFPTLKKWMESPDIDRIAPNLKAGVLETIRQGRIEDLVNAYRQQIRFGTGGIRGMMAFDRESIVRMKEEGIDAPILKGPNTLNDVVLLLTSAGVAQFGRQQSPPLETIVIGYDSRVRGQDLAQCVAELFLAYGYQVFFFDEPCPYPEVTFAIPDIKADMGILISASHNDYRYNGYKLSCQNGSQFDPEERDAMYNQYIAKATFADIKRLAFADAPLDKLVFLGGKQPVAGRDYLGRESTILDEHTRHANQMKSFVLMENLAERQKRSPLKIAFCAYHGAGRIAVPRLLNEVGFTDIRTIHARGLFELNGLFPSFCSDPGREQQPDPGDARAARTAVEAFNEEYPGQFADVDIMIGTDPDADRCGIVVKVPPEQRHIYGGQDYYLLPADDAWALLLWYRFTRLIEKHGRLPDADKQFITLSHTTSDANIRLARKFGLGVIKTWVGFASLAAATRDAWLGKTDVLLGLVNGCDGRKYAELCHPFVCDVQGMEGRRSINAAAMEQSNGFSILGGPPKDRRSMGEGGHVRDKDGTFAALLMAEVAAWAKENGTTLFKLVDERIYLDPQIGMFVNLYEPDPLDGEYPGIEGDRLKKGILLRALDAYRAALKGGLSIGGATVKSAVIYRTGKYDRLYPPEGNFVFPDEGVRFFFDDEQVQHVLCRPSGTGNSLRFHVQLHGRPTKESLLADKQALRRKAKRIMDGIRELVGAPRN